MDSYNKLFMIIRKTDLLNYDEREELLLYLMNLKDQVKSQKEVINDVIEYVENRIVEDDYMLKVDTDMVQKELLYILKGCQNE